MENCFPRPRPANVLVRDRGSVFDLGEVDCSCSSVAVDAANITARTRAPRDSDGLGVVRIMHVFVEEDVVDAEMVRAWGRYSEALLSVVVPSGSRACRFHVGRASDDCRIVDRRLALCVDAFKHSDVHATLHGIRDSEVLEVHVSERLGELSVATALVREEVLEVGDDGCVGRALLETRFLERCVAREYTEAVPLGRMGFVVVE